MLGGRGRRHRRLASTPGPSMMSRISTRAAPRTPDRAASPSAASVGGGDHLADDRARRRREHVARDRPDTLASSIECVTKNTVACASRQSSTSSSCMCSRVVGSSAPNGSSIRMMRGDRISVRAIATRCRMPPDSSLGILAGVALHVEADLGDPLARQLTPLAAPARRGTRGRTRRCPRRCGCRTTCSPGTPCCGRTRAPTGLPPTSTVPSRGRISAGAAPRSAAAPWTCRSPTGRGSR